MPILSNNNLNTELAQCTINLAISWWNRVPNPSCNWWAAVWTFPLNNLTVLWTGIGHFTRTRRRTMTSSNCRREIPSACWKSATMAGTSERAKGRGSSARSLAITSNASDPADYTKLGCTLRWDRPGTRRQQVTTLAALTASFHSHTARQKAYIFIASHYSFIDLLMILNCIFFWNTACPALIQRSQRISYSISAVRF